MPPNIRNIKRIHEDQIMKTIDSYLNPVKNITFTPEQLNYHAKYPWQKSNHIRYQDLPPSLKTYAPISNKYTHRVDIIRMPLWSGRPLRHLSAFYPDSGGRAATGLITARHRGGGAQSRTITVNYKYSLPEVPKRLIGLEYNRKRRTVPFSIVWYENGFFAYQPMIDGVQRGTYFCGLPKDPNMPAVGEWWKLGKIPARTKICNVEQMPNEGGVIARVAGTFCVILEQKPESLARRLVPVLMPSKEVKLLSEDCWGTIGRIGYPDHKFERLGSAGRNRRRGVRPTVRGCAQDPNKHRHGGHSGGRPVGHAGGRYPGPYNHKGKFLPHHKPTRRARTKYLRQLFIMRNVKESRKLTLNEAMNWEYKNPLKKESRHQKHKTYRTFLRYRLDKIQKLSEIGLDRYLPELTPKKDSEIVFPNSSIDSITDDGSVEEQL